MYGLLWFLERTSTYLMLTKAHKNRPRKFGPEEVNSAHKAPCLKRLHIIYFCLYKNDFGLRHLFD